MKNRFEEIDYFLKSHAACIMQNPTFEFTPDWFYSNLSTWGLPQKDLNDRMINSYWNEWQNYFNGSNFEKCYWDQRQAHFLQFRNQGNNDSETLKLYLSYDKEHIGKAVKMIFDFIDKNHFGNCSKVAEKTRSDSICIRPYKVEDTKKIIEYINNNPYLRDNALSTNPFVHRSGVVGMAYDNMISYNSTLSDVIYGYMYSKKLNNDLNNVGYADFREYASKYGKALFSDKDSIIALSNSPKFSNRRNYVGCSTVELLENYYSVFDLVGKELDPNFSDNDYYNLTNNYRNINSKRMVQDNIAEVVSGNDDTLDFEKIYYDYIEYATYKYGNILTAFNCVEEFLGGNTKAITRDNNFRELFVKNLSKGNLPSIMGGDERYKEKIVMEAYDFTLNKYGFDHLYEAYNLVCNRDYKMISNGDKGYRSFMKQFVSKEEAVSIFQKYANQIINNSYYSPELTDAFRSMISSSKTRS